MNFRSFAVVAPLGTRNAEWVAFGGASGQDGAKKPTRRDPLPTRPGTTNAGRAGSIDGFGWVPMTPARAAADIDGACAELRAARAAVANATHRGALELGEDAVSEQIEHAALLRAIEGSRAYESSAWSSRCVPASSRSISGA